PFGLAFPTLSDLFSIRFPRVLSRFPLSRFPFRRFRLYQKFSAGLTGYSFLSYRGMLLENVDVDFSEAD
ncbi:hypothetical protein, partial [Streptomyces lucensis]|uniref:hypothetical protein n=1 Tax=Streptomyces lucensis TaxID=67319 RepID=UPI001E28B80C